MFRVVETIDELEKIEAMGAEDHLAVGLHDRLLQWRHSPDSHILFVDKTTDDIVGYGVANPVAASTILLHMVFIKKQYRSGTTYLGIHFKWTTFLSKGNGNLPVNFVGNCNEKALKLTVRLTNSIVTQQLPVYKGPVVHETLSKLPMPDGVTIRLVEDEEDMVMLLAYDKTIHSIADRSSFLRSWCTNDQFASTTIAVSEDGECLGYSCLRRESGQIEPAYADNNHVAQALIVGVLRTCAENESVELTIPADQTTGVEFCEALGWTIAFTEHRIYSMANPDSDLPWEKIYGIHHFFLL